MTNYNKSILIGMYDTEKSMIEFSFIFKFYPMINAINTIIVLDIYD